MIPQIRSDMAGEILEWLSAREEEFEIDRRDGRNMDAIYFVLDDLREHLIDIRDWRNK